MRASTRLLLVLGCCAASAVAATAEPSTQIPAQDKSALLEAAGLPYSAGQIRAYYSEGHQDRAANVAPLVAEAMDFYQAALNIESPMAIAVLGADDWLRFADGIPYGLPFVAGAETPVAFIPATGDGVLAKGATALRSQASAATLSRIAKTGMDFDAGAAAFVDAIVLHELGHVQGDAYGIQPKSRWLGEFIATYFAYGFLRDKHPELAEILEIYAYRLNLDAARPQASSLVRFEAEYDSMDAHDYAWYQGMFVELAMQLYDQRRLALLPALKQQLAAGDNAAAPDSPPQAGRANLEAEFSALDRIDPLFRKWAVALKLL